MKLKIAEIHCLVVLFDGVLYNSSSKYCVRNFLLSNEFKWRKTSILI